jgi:hypothetical protein
MDNVDYATMVSRLTQLLKLHPVKEAVLIIKYWDNKCFAYMYYIFMPWLGRALVDSYIQDVWAGQGYGDGIEVSAGEQLAKVKKSLTCNSVRYIVAEVEFSDNNYLWN